MTHLEVGGGLVGLYIFIIYRTFNNQFIYRTLNNQMGGDVFNGTDNNCIIIPWNYMDETYINIYLTSALPAGQPVVVLAGILKKHTFTTVSKPLHRICRKCGCMSRVLSGKYKKIHCCSEKPTYLCIRNNKTKIITIKNIRLWRL